MFRTHGENQATTGSGLSVNDLEAAGPFASCPSATAAELEGNGDTTLPYERSAALARFRGQCGARSQGSVRVPRDPGQSRDVESKWVFVPTKCRSSRSFTWAGASVLESRRGPETSGGSPTGDADTELLELHEARSSLPRLLSAA